MYELKEAIFPPPIAYSRNPLLFTWKLLPHSEDIVDLNFVLNVRVEVRTSIYTVAKNFTLRPDAQGVFAIDIQSYVDAQLAFAMPNLHQEYPQIAHNQYCDYAVSAKLTNDYESITTLPNKWFKAIKGGLAAQYNDVERFITHNILQMKQALHFPFEGEEVGANDTIIVTALAIIDPNDANYHTSILEASASIHYRYLDHNLVYSNWESLSSTTAVKYGAIIHTPFNVHNHAPANSVANGLKKLELEVRLAFDGDDYTIATLEYYINNSHKNDTSSLIYVNSLGGYNTLSMYSIDELNYDYTRVQVRSIDLGKFLSKNIIQHQISNAYTEEQVKYKFITAALHQEELDRLRDLHFGRIAYLLKNNRTLPVSVSDQNMRLTEVDGMYNLAIALDEALVNVNYTAANTINDHTTCPIPKYLIVAQSDSNSIDVHYGLAPNQFEGKIEVTNFANSSTIRQLISSNEGVIKIDTTSLNVNNANFYYVYVKLYTQCGDVWSNFKQEEYEVQKTAQPSLPTLIANTYEGVGFRVLTFQTNSKNILHSASLNNDAQLYNFDVHARVSPSLSSNGSSAWGGTFQIQTVPGTAQQWMAARQINYAPPSLFAGRDVITYYARAMQRPLGPNTSAFAVGKILVNVQGADPNATQTNQAVYVRVIYRNYDPRRHRAGYVENTIRFFSDPLGLNPLDVTGRNIVIEINYMLVRNPTINVRRDVLNATGSSMNYYHYYRIDGAGEVDGTFEPSNQYYMI